METVVVNYSKKGVIPLNSKSKKTLLLSVLLVMIIAVSYYFIGQGKPQPEVTSELIEILPNGEMKARIMEEVDVETTQWLRQKEADLQLLIAQQTGLKGEDILVSTSSKSKLSDTNNPEITCSVVLNTASTFDDQIIQNVVDGIIDMFKQDKVSATISKENIVIANNNSEVLH